MWNIILYGGGASLLLYGFVFIAEQTEGEENKTIRILALLAYLTIIFLFFYNYYPGAGLIILGVLFFVSFIVLIKDLVNSNWGIVQYISLGLWILAIVWILIKK